MTGYFEGDSTFTTLPDWVRWSISLGLGFPVSSIAGPRGMLLVSTPCESPIAGLVSLGIVMRDLARAGATDVENHADAVRGWAGQYLSRCRTCEVRCDPGKAGCGFTVESSGELSKVGDNAGERRTRFFVESLGGDGTLTLREARRRNAQQSPTIWRFGSGHNPNRVLSQFLPDGWPMPEAVQPMAALDVTPHRLLAPDWSPVDEWRSQSYSGACLVGKRAGTADMQRGLERVGFALDGNRYHLPAMLSIMGWSGKTVSRLRFYNSRRGGGFGFDRPGSNPEVTIVDGARELADVVSFEKVFGSSSMIGVVPRDSDTNDLQGLSLALDERHYGPQGAGAPALDPPPPGITIQWMARR